MIEQYCTEAIGSKDWLNQTSNGKPFSEQWTKQRLHEAVKFSLPDNGHIVMYPKNISMTDFIIKHAEHIRIPYPCIAIQFRTPTDPGPIPDWSRYISDAAIALCIQMECGIAVQPLFREIRTKEWHRCHVVFFIGNSGVITVDSTNGRAIYDNEPLWAETHEEHSCLLWAVAGLITALACSNSAEPEDVPPPKYINDKRIKKGKTPFYSYKILTLSSSSDPESRHLGGTHASPRVHLRRGHVRRLAEKTVWVNACVVGDKSKGVVEKDYAVSGAL